MPPSRARSQRKREQAAGLAVMVVDDHPLWRETLRRVIEREGIGSVVAEACDGDEAVDLAASARPDLIIMDMALPTLGGVEATRRIRAASPDVKVLVLSSFETRSSVLQAVSAGASGYLLKTAGAREVAQAVKRVSEGDLVFPPKLADVVLQEFRRLSKTGSSPTSLRVALAGDSGIHREGLARVLEEAGFDVMVLRGNLTDLTQGMETEPPDIVVLDFHAAPDTGLRLATRLRLAQPELRVLILSQDFESPSAFELISHATGGIGYLLRDRIGDVEQLGEAMRRVVAGEAVIDPAVVNRLVDGRESDALSALTDREREVLSLMAEGRSNQSIGERLFVSNKTLEKHIRSIFSKLGLEETNDTHRRVLAVITYLRSL